RTQRGAGGDAARGDEQGARTHAPGANHHARRSRRNGMPRRRGSTPLFDGKAVPKTQFTFPDPVAYGVTVKGRVRRAKRWAKFTVTFGLRADPRPASG